jgi:hypothetical protein
MLCGKAVLRIRGILYGAGSVHWITDAALDPDPSLFGSRVQDANRNELFSKFFLLISYGRHKISCHLRSHKKINHGYLNYFASCWKDPDPYK